eukprot:TRINITY_DN23694_c0_g2_i1.p1 TRINITY_DN23694_c0_g2~~TRINITY_DN23694_c0_g2_i1.p1  ORF type:complete len:348 (+),score=27.38 TRINITY_DN23694_c0_g2_i1:155-1198(+)
MTADCEDAEVMAWTDEDRELDARRELLAIHPNVRAEIVQKIGVDAWAAMSTCEKRDTAVQLIGTVGTDSAQDWEKDVARRVADTILDTTDTDPIADIAKGVEEPAPVEADTGPRYWAPAGRCPYGMDRGDWAISAEELRQHNSSHSCWIAIDGDVYDVTKWLNQHPGGASTILESAGGDASASFRAAGHSARAVSLKEKLRVGRFHDPEEIAKKELIAIHPSIRSDIVQRFGMETWASMTTVEKLELVKRHMPDDGTSHHSGNRADPSASSGLDGEASSTRIPSSTDSGTDGEVCPITGKAGTCPQQGLRGNHGRPEPSAEHDAGKGDGHGKGKGNGKGKAEECVIS